MTIQLGIVMDDIAHIKPYKDTSLAMLLAAQARNWPLWYMQLNDLFLQNGQPYAHMQRLQVRDIAQDWFTLTEPTTAPLDSLPVILMRKDPPFNLEYIMATYLLEQAEARGALVVNKPQSLRDANEKLFAAWFPHCCPPTLVTRQAAQLRAFLTEQQDIVIKPLDGMGGQSIFRVKQGDVNTSVIIETITEQQSRYVMAQQFIPAISQGDKRILLLDGEPVPYALARIPAAGEGEGRELTERDRWICQQVAPVLRAKGLLFVGLDVIGDYLTEINVTSPTCVRELDRAYDLDIAGQFIEIIAQRLT